ncbi:hypothetical protein [Streptomyces griseoaurantiacus]|uniref:hypothetical protein n=1 Tax=Streptomyces griseoaurantiacus TaxID=68213 RepID=UPI00369F9B12
MSQSEEADVRTATARADDDGNWYLTVEGTDIKDEKVMEVADPVGPDYLPGAGLGHRLIERGFMPDRSAVDSHDGTAAGRLAATADSGWTRTGEDTWTIPCSPYTA